MTFSYLGGRQCQWVTVVLYGLLRSGSVSGLRVGPSPSLPTTALQSGEVAEGDHAWDFSVKLNIQM